MQILIGLLFLTGAYPLARAFHANRHTTLWQTLFWVLAAWVSWVLVLWIDLLADREMNLNMGRYLSLSLTGCAGIAVLGARRPGVAAWHAVLIGLLAVLLLPLVEQLVVGDRPPGWLRFVFVAGTLLVGIINYLPTRLAPAAIVLGVGCAAEFFRLIEPEWQVLPIPVGWLALGLTPWIAFWSWRRGAAGDSKFDRIWRDFRDRYGLVWAQRVREQFNRAAHHAGWPVLLHWRGLDQRAESRQPVEATRTEMLTTLKALLKRFATEMTVD